MASFCYDCTEWHFGEGEKNDMQGIAEPEMAILDICEGCGGKWFDWDGLCVDPSCESHGGEA